MIASESESKRVHVIKTGLHFCKHDVMTPFRVDSYSLSVAGGFQEYAGKSQKWYFSSQNGEKYDHFNPIFSLVIFVIRFI